MDERQLLKILETTNEHLDRIGNLLERIARGNAPEEPNHIKPLEQFSTFDWASIGASIVQSDQFGPTHVEWNGTLWTRRSPVNKFEGAIWFSRANGKDAEGNVHYLRLITFREVKGADPLPATMAEKVKPAPAETSATNGNGHRPYTPDKLRTRLAEIGAKHTGKEASEKQRQFLAMLLEKCFAGDDDAKDKRHTVQLYLFGVASLKDTFDSMVLAALDWLKPAKDTGGDYNPDWLAAKEAQAVYTQALVAEGQAELPI